ncbi:hypothetical protein L596_028134 [Steinernema carpocapsae]|uniref:Uncharacterized protein n=1 Tax=Steinernema carpocapsae TaxID=34508 RepID=A0A4U5LXI3_STECR|nr:hypothetical protein L596_028134 [Steinernema carpocapsae]
MDKYDALRAKMKKKTKNKELKKTREEAISRQSDVAVEAIRKTLEAVYKVRKIKDEERMKSKQLVRASNARTYRQVVAAERLFQAAFSVEKVKYIDVFGLFDTVHELGYIEDAKPYLVEALKFKIRNEGFNAALVSYKVQLKHDRTTVGLHLLFREAVKNWSESRITFENRLRTVIKLASSLDGPFDIFGELIVAMVLEGRLAEAQVLFKKLSIPGNHFCMPLSRLSNEPENLEAVEKFAELIDSCILAERRKKSKGKAEAEPKVSADDEATARSVGFLVKDWHTTRKKYSTQKVKRYKVNDEKLDKLYNVMLRVWADLAVNSNNKESMRKLKKWIDTNQISLSEKLAERINRFLQN